MEEKKLLKEIGLSNYETAVYLKLVELGKSEASTLHREAKVPFGRIYEELNSLISKGLVEVQNTRPKRYMPKKPKIAFNNLLKRKKEDMEGQFQKTVEMVSQIEEGISKHMPTEPKEKAFWTVAVGREEIAEMMKYNFDEAEKELCIITRGRVEDRKKHWQLIPEMLNSLINAIKRGVRLKVLVSKDFTIPEGDGYIDKEKLRILLNKVEVRVIRDVRSYFEICDNSKVMIKIDNPANLTEILAVIRIYDIKLARELRNKFDELWIKAKPLKLEN